MAGASYQARKAIKMVRVEVANARRRYVREDARQRYIREMEIARELRERFESSPLPNPTTAKGNPYIDTLKKMFKDYGGVNIFEGRNPTDNLLKSGALVAMELRWPFVQRFAFAIPTSEAVAKLVKLSPIIEVGSGNGYWAWLVRKAGGEFQDSDTYHRQENCKNGFWKVWWTKPKRRGPSWVKGFPKATLFLCWPEYDSPMAFKALKSFRGKRVVYIGEGYGGCTGNERFHETLDKDWIEEQKITLPSWPGVWDDMRIYRRLCSKT